MTKYRQDFLGRDLAEEDWVVLHHPRYSTLQLAKVMGFTKTKVNLELNGYSPIMAKFRTDSYRLCKIRPDDIMMYLMK